MQIVNYFILFLSALMLFLSCEQESFITDGSASIEFSTDTISFDTIFTQVGSVTHRFKIYNRNKKDIRIEKAYLAGGQDSEFRISIDAVNDVDFESVEIPGEDSLYVFVEVTLDPINGNHPMIVKDSIVFMTNGNYADVNLIAYGQDVHLLKSRNLQTQTWKNDKPYLIINNCGVDTGHVLTIEKGVSIHFGHNSSMLVWGQLLVKGTYEEPIVFEGARFDRGYDRSAGRWGTIYFHPISAGNRLEYAHIKNASAGIQIGIPGDQEEVADLELYNCFIQNASSIGIYAFGSEVTAYNTVIADCKYQCVALLMGGTYNFYHCTLNSIGAFYNYYGIFERYERHEGPGVLGANFFNWYEVNEDFQIVEKVYHQELVEANFYNCIIYGLEKEEIKFIEKDETPLNYKFDHCLIKNIEDSLDLENSHRFNKVFFNEYPRFVNDSLLNGEHDFRLDTLSPAKDSGSIELINANPILEFDFEGKSRIEDGMPDLGAFERKE